MQAYANLANAYLQKGDIDKSIEINKKALEIAPDFGLVHNNIAYAYYLKGEYQKAIAHCDKARELGFQVHPDFLKELEPYRQKG